MWMILHAAPCDELDNAGLSDVEIHQHVQKVVDLAEKVSRNDVHELVDEARQAIKETPPCFWERHLPTIVKLVLRSQCGSFIEDILQTGFGTLAKRNKNVDIRIWADLRDEFGGCSYQSKTIK